ncbi:MAG: SGNH/GDSL hydrolase family protein [Beijerinckiaceae bacterium]
MAWALAAALIGAMAAAPPALAQNEALQFILDQARQRQRRDARPVLPRRSSGARIIELPRRVQQTPVVVVHDTPDKVKVDPSIFIVVFGDSMGEFLGAGIEEVFADQADVLVTRRTRAESGLVRNDFYDWPKSLQEFLSGQNKISFAVMQLGVNDRQALRDEAGQSHEPGTDKWRELYGQRIDAVARIFAEKQIPLLWVGMPPMPYASYSASMRELNEIVRQHVLRTGGLYIDVWDSFADSQGRYAPSGPDINGQITRLRAGDGVHFNRAGARKAAHFVEIELKRMIGNRGPTSVIALPSDPSAAAPLPMELQAGGIERAIDRMVAGITDLAPPVSVPVKPVAGAIIPLTQDARAQGGVLLTRATATPPVLGNNRPFDFGRIAEPKPGRADDFRWPAP